MVGVVCDLAEVLIVVTDINSDEQRDEDDQSQTREGAEECGSKSLLILCTLLLCTAKQIELGIKISNTVKC